LLTAGFREAERGEFSFRAYINGKTDLTRTEAAREITAAKTGDARSRAAGRLAGTLYNEIASIKQLLLRTRAAIEAEIEYPEDENAIAGAFDDSALKDAGRRLSRLCDTWVSEKLYQEGVRVVLCGRTNAGKSSVFNALLKEDRAIVSDVHGTTRDWLESWVSFDGLPVRLFDTAGLRETVDAVERSGVERTLGLAGDADCILYIVDAEIGITTEDEAFLCSYNQQSNIPLITIFNKIDKLSENNYTGLGMSAKTGEGIPAVIATVNKALKQSGTEKGSAQAGLGSTRQKKCAEEALAAVKNGIFAGENGFPLDAVVQDVDDALTALGEITGEVTPEDILDTVFANFCVGK
jgi:tRNA modification GTPase